MIGVADEIGMG